MPKKAKFLSASEVRDLKPKTVQDPDNPRHGEPYVTYHPVGGVAGLLLRVTPEGGKSWILRTTVGKLRRDYGLGGFPDVTLADARRIAREYKEQIRAGIDPAEEKRKAREALEQAQGKRLTFREAAIKCHRKFEPEFKSAKHKRDWINSITMYAVPLIGNKQVADIDIHDVLKVLEPIWSTKTETATRVRQRMESILSWATVSKYREGDNPARWSGNLDAVLSKPTRITKVQHHPALPYQHVGLFVRDLRKREGAGARALEFAILCAARSLEVRGATWDEIDFDNKLWHLTAERMKRDKAHTVPLSDQAIALLNAQERRSDSEFIFPAVRGGMVSDATLSATVKRMHEDELKAGGNGWIDPETGRRIVPHGFRSSFKDWARSCTRFADEVSELALAHINDDKTRAAYARDQLIPKRIPLMQQWADYCGEVIERGTVSRLKTGTR